MSKELIDKKLKEVGYDDDPIVETCKYCRHSYYINNNVVCHGCCKDYSSMKCTFDKEFEFTVSQDARCKNFQMSSNL